MQNNLPKQTINGTVQTVNFLRSGTGQNGKPWTMFKVEIIPGGGDAAPVQFTTFDKKFQNLIGKVGNYEYTESQSTGRDGKSYTNRTLSYLPKEGGATSGGFTEADRQMLKEILRLVSIPTTGDSPDDFEVGLENNNEDYNA